MERLPEFSSPYNDRDKIDERIVFHAMDQQGKIHRVREEFVPDSRYGSGMRLERRDTDTDEDLMKVSLCVLPEDFVAHECWMMLTIKNLLNEVTDLRHELNLLKDDCEQSIRHFNSQGF